MGMWNTAEGGADSALSNDEYDKALESTGSSYRMPDTGGSTNSVSSYPQSVPVEQQQANAMQQPVGGSVHGLVNQGGGQVTANPQTAMPEGKKEDHKNGFNWMAIVSALL